MSFLSPLFLILSLIWVSADAWSADPVGALIYHGVATAYGDDEAIEGILDTLGISYQEASSDELNDMTLDHLSQFRMIVWPGGYAGQMSRSLTAATRDRIRLAVQERGVSFVGICAGAFIAVSPAAEPGAEGPSWGLSLIAAETLPYYHLEDEGVDYAMVDLDFARGPRRSLVWWGGPTLPEVTNGVIARYRDNHLPAMIQTWSGKGFVILSGPHPEAPLSWKTKLGLSDSAGLEQDIAALLFQAALNREPLPTIH